MPGYRIGFVIEQILGHVTHDRHLRRRVAEDPQIEPEWLPVQPWAADVWQSLPVIGGNWTLLSGARAAGTVADARRRGPLDLLYYHTQVPALGGLPLMRRIPAVLSLDATPVNMDQMGIAYGHPVGSAPAEAVKRVVYRHLFGQAAHVVALSRWVADSLRTDYRVPADKVSVIPPGIDPVRRHRPRLVKRPGAPVRLLFVGGDFRRKGGSLLLEVLDSLPGARRWELDVVTREPVDPGGRTWVRLHYGLTPDCPELAALFAAADLFVLPTLGDALGSRSWRRWRPGCR